MIALTAQDVLRHVNGLIGIHRELLALAGEKKQAIIDNRVDDVSRIVNQESRLVRKIEEAEKEWKDLARHFAEAQGLRKKGALTLGEMIRHIHHADEKLALKQAQQELVTVISELKKANELNQDLIRQSLAFINYSLDLMTGSDDYAIYDRPDSRRHAGRKGFFDVQA